MSMLIAVIGAVIVAAGVNALANGLPITGIACVAVGAACIWIAVTWDDANDMARRGY